MAGPEGSGATKAKGPIMSELTTAEPQAEEGLELAA